jgi:hypothetical protein
MDLGDKARRAKGAARYLLEVICYQESKELSRASKSREGCGLLGFIIVKRLGHAASFYFA